MVSGLQSLRYSTRVVVSGLQRVHYNVCVLQSERYSACVSVPRLHCVCYSVAQLVACSMRAFPLAAVFLGRGRMFQLACIMDRIACVVRTYARVYAHIFSCAGIPVRNLHHYLFYSFYFYFLSSSFVTFSLKTLHIYRHSHFTPSPLGYIITEVKNGPKSYSVTISK